ncbi:MAG: TolC family protein [Desulfobacca sp.]|nr:TolC family protein [Desulfobacca sp.]
MTGARKLPLSLDQSIELALKNNRNLQTARRSLTTAASAYRAAKGGYYPQVTGSVSSSHGLANQLEAFPRVVNRWSGGFQITLDMPLDLSGSIGRAVQQALIRLLDTKARYVLASQDLVVNVYTQYYDILRARETMIIDRALVEQTQEQLRIAQERLKAGRVPEVDVLTASVQLDNASQTMKADEGAYENALATLRNTLVLDQQIEIIPTDKLTYVPETFEYQTCVQEAVQNRLEMQTARLSLESAKISLKSTYDRYLPSLNVSGGWDYNVTGRNPPEAIEERPKGPSWNIIARINVPIFIFDGGVIRESKVQALTSIDQAEANVHQTREDIELEVKSEVINLNNALERVNIVKNSIKLAKESLNIEELRYRMGLTSYLELTNAQQNLRTAELNLLTAIIQYNLSKERLYRALGRALVTVAD